MRTTTIITTTTTPWQPTKIRFLNTSHRHNIRPSSLRQQSAACALDQLTWSSGWTSTSAASSPDQRVSAETGCLHSACNVTSHTRQLVLCVHSFLHSTSPTCVSWFSESIHSFIHHHPHASAGSLSPFTPSFTIIHTRQLVLCVQSSAHTSAGSLCPFTPSFTISSVSTAVFHVTVCLLVVLLHLFTEQNFW